MSKEEPKDRERALEKVIQGIEKQFGAGTLMKLNEVKRVDSDCVPTGFIGLDAALGVGGIPRGRVIEIFGPEGSGKSTLAMEILASVQKTGGTAVFIDAEHALDPTYVRNLGVDLDSLYICQPDYGEQALFIADELIRSHAVDIVVIDSVAALTPRDEIEGEIGDTHVAMQARMMSQALRKLNAQINLSRTIVIFINQIREKVGGPSFGNNEVTPGGRALKFFASLRIEVRRKESIKDGKGSDIIGHRCKVSIKKNKVAPPFKDCEMEIYYGEGFSSESSLLSEALNLGIVDKSGAWFSFGETRLGQGFDNARKFLQDNAHYGYEIYQQIKERIFRQHEELEIAHPAFEKEAA